MNDFQAKYVSRLTPLSKTELKAKLEAEYEVLIFSGNPREIGILGRDYFASFNEDTGTYDVTYVDWDYNEEPLEFQFANTFTNYDDLWTAIINMMEDSDFSPEYNYLPDSAGTPVTEALLTKNSKVDKHKFAEFIFHQSTGKAVPIFYEKRGLTGQTGHGTAYRVRYHLNGEYNYFCLTRDKGFKKEAVVIDTFSNKTGHGIDRLWDHMITTLAHHPDRYYGAFKYQDPRLPGTPTNEACTTVTVTNLDTDVLVEAAKTFSNRNTKPIDKEAFRKMVVPASGNGKRLVVYYNKQSKLSIIQGKDLEYSIQYIRPSKGTPYLSYFLGFGKTITEITKIEDIDGNAIDTFWNIMIRTLREQPESYYGAYDYQESRLREGGIETDETQPLPEDHVCCKWCGKELSSADCEVDLNLGYLCSTCCTDLQAHGESLTLITDMLKDIDSNTLDEGLSVATISAFASGVIASLIPLIMKNLEGAIVGGFVWDGMKGIATRTGKLVKVVFWWIVDRFRALFKMKPLSEFAVEKNYIIEKTPEGQINILDIEGKLRFEDLKDMETAKAVIRALPDPELSEEALETLKEKAAKLNPMSSEDTTTDTSLEANGISVEAPREMTSDELIAEFGTDDVELINTSIQPTPKVVLKEATRYVGGRYLPGTDSIGTRRGRVLNKLQKTFTHKMTKQDFINWVKDAPYEEYGDLPINTHETNKECVLFYEKKWHHCDIIWEVMRTYPYIHSGYDVPPLKYADIVPKYFILKDGEKVGSFDEDDENSPEKIWDWMIEVLVSDPKKYYPAHEYIDARLYYARNNVRNESLNSVEETVDSSIVEDLETLDDSSTSFDLNEGFGARRYIPFSKRNSKKPVYKSEYHDMLVNSATRGNGPVIPMFYHFEQPESPVEEGDNTVYAVEYAVQYCKPRNEDPYYLFLRITPDNQVTELEKLSDPGRIAFDQVWKKYVCDCMRTVNLPIVGLKFSPNEVLYAFNYQERFLARTSGLLGDQKNPIEKQKCNTTQNALQLHKDHYQTSTNNKKLTWASATGRNDNSSRGWKIPDDKKLELDANGNLID